MKKLLLSLTIAMLSAMAFAQTPMRYTAPDGVFFSGYNNQGGVLAPYIYMPYRTSYTWTSTETGDWTDGVHTATAAQSFTITDAVQGGKNDIPSFQVGDSVYQYGKNSTTSGAKVVYYGNSSYSVMTNAQLFVTGASKSMLLSTFKLPAYASSYRIYFYNAPEENISIKDIYIPLTANDSKKTSADIFPEGAKMTVKIYPATYSRGDDGKYTKSYTKTALASTTLDVSNFTPYSNTSTSYGSLNWNLTDTLNIKGAFMVELSEFSTMGVAYLRADAATGVSTQYVKVEDSKLYAGTYNMVIGVNAMFPALYKHDSADEINFKAEGETADKVKICANVNPTGWKITKPDWITYETTFQKDNKFYTNRDVYLTFTAAANIGEAREGTITINNRGKEITYTVKQAAPAVAGKTYGFCGTFCAWDATKAIPFTKVDDTLTVTIDSLYGEYKVVVDNACTESYGAWGDVYELLPGHSAYGMTSNDGKNFKVSDSYLNAVFKIYNEDEQLKIRFCSGMKVVVPVCVPNFGLLVNGTVYYPGTENTELGQWEIKNVTLTAGDLLQAKDTCSGAAWTPAFIDHLDYFGTDGKLLESGVYSFYLKLGDGDKLYIVKESVSPTDLDNVNAKAVVIKQIVNGQLIIIRDGVRYNSLGAIVE